MVLLGSRIGKKVHSEISIFAVFCFFFLSFQAHAEELLVKSGEYVVHAIAAAQSQVSTNTFGKSRKLEVLPQGAQLISTRSTLQASSHPSSNFTAYDAKIHADDCAKIKSDLLAADVDFVCEPNFIFKASLTPNDQLYSSQYAAKQMSLESAWEVSQGSSDIVVAVVDTGVDYTHPDLAANMWQNTAEIAGNLIDDDKNGFVDDIYGVNVAQETSDPMDDDGHGTHVAGIIGGAGNNGRGVVGANWNVKLMSVKFIDKSGFGTLSGAIKAIDYSVSMGARVINASWGALGANSTELKKAIQRAGDAGVLFVAAAGNDGVNTDEQAFYPSGFDLTNIISVAATTRTDSLAWYSNYGLQSVDIAAPGDSIYSTYLGGSYQYLSGTSMAAPQITGVAALMLSVNANLQAESLKQILIESSDSLAELSSQLPSGARVNASAALSAALNGGTVARYSLSVGSRLANGEFVASQTLRKQYAVKVQSVDASEQSVGQVSVELNGYECALGAVDLSAGEAMLLGKISSQLKGKMHVSLSVNNQLKASTLVSVNAVKAKQLKKKAARTIRLANLSEYQAGKLCAQLVKGLR